MGTRSAKNTRVFLPPPVLGVNFWQAVATLQSGYAPFMVNMHVENGKAVKRNAHTQEIVLPGSTELTPLVVPHVDTGISKIIAVGDTTTEDSDGNTSSTPSLVSNLSDYTFYKGSYHFASKSGATGQVDYLNPGSSLTWTTGLTYTAASGGSRVQICSYRERLYIGQKTTLHYGGVGAISGAVAGTFNLEDLISGEIHALEKVSAFLGDSLEQLLVVVSSMGEVLVFSGSNPGASDWSLRQEFSLPFNASFLGGLGHVAELVPIPNDLLICSTAGFYVYSIKDLLLSQNPSQYEPCRFLKDIGFTTRWIKTTTYWPTRNAIVIVAGIDKTKSPYLDSWDGEALTTSASSGTKFGHISDVAQVIFLVDLDDGHIELHSYNDEITGAAGRIRAAGDIVACPSGESGFRGSAYRLFDPDDTTYQDFDGDSIQGVIMLPLNSRGFRKKDISSMVLYSNLNSSHSLELGVGKSFSTRPPTFSDFSTSDTDTDPKEHVLPGGASESAPMITLRESSANSSPFEFYGIDLLVEEGGEF